MNDQVLASGGAAFPILPLRQLVAAMVLFVANRMRMLSLSNIAGGAVPDEDQAGGVGLFAFMRAMAIFAATGRSGFCRALSLPGSRAGSVRAGTDETTAA
jgi:hypothetical protein